MPQPARRLLYLLTLWCECPDAPSHPAVWRFRLEDAHTAAQYGFGSLEELTTFLQKQMETDTKNKEAR